MQIAWGTSDVTFKPLTETWHLHLPWPTAGNSKKAAEDRPVVSVTTGTTHSLLLGGPMGEEAFE